MKVLIIWFLLVSHLLANDCTLGLKHKDDSKKYNYILVTGILNEVIPNYFDEYESFLLSLGVDKSQIFRVNSRSSEVPTVAAQNIERVIDGISNGKQNVFIAHSKGALETLYYLMGKEALNDVKFALLMQGALDGSSLYRLYYEKRKSKWDSDFLQLFFSEKYTREFSYKEVRRKLTGLKDRVDLLSKITFVRSQTSYENLPFKYKFVGALFKKHFGNVGDGVLLKSDHLPFELKEMEAQLCIKDYVIDHAYYVTSLPWESKRKDDIRSFLRSHLFYK